MSCIPKDPSPMTSRAETEELCRSSSCQPNVKPSFEAWRRGHIPCAILCTVWVCKFSFRSSRQNCCADSSPKLILVLLVEVCLVSIGHTKAALPFARGRGRGRGLSHFLHGLHCTAVFAATRIAIFMAGVLLVVVDHRLCTCSGFSPSRCTRYMYL